MSDRYSYIARIVYTNDDEHDEYFNSEEQAREWAENLDTNGIAGFQILRMDWYMHCEAVIWEEWYDIFEDEPDFRSVTAGDYGSANPWDAPGMSVRDFI